VTNQSNRRRYNVHVCKQLDWSVILDIRKCEVERVTCNPV